MKDVVVNFLISIANKGIEFLVEKRKICLGDQFIELLYFWGIELVGNENEK